MTSYYHGIYVSIEEIRKYFCLIEKMSSAKFDVIGRYRKNEDIVAYHVCKDATAEQLVQAMREDNAVEKNLKHKIMYDYKPVFVDSLNFFFLDDPDEGLMKEVGIYDSSIIVRTSENKIQANVFVDKHYSCDEIKLLQRYMIKETKADTGGNAVNHFRKVPYLFNHKYQDAFFVTAHKQSIFRLFNASNIINKLKQQQSRQSINRYMLQHKHKSDGLLTKTMSWDSYYLKTLDESRADFSYVLHLIKHGYTKEQIKERLIEESKDIEKRKGKHMNDYLERTIDKAFRESFYFKNSNDLC